MRRCPPWRKGPMVLLMNWPSELVALVPQLREQALSRRSGAPVVLEASGIQPSDLAAYAATGIDLISTSAPVTRSSWLDLSMRFSGLPVV